MSREAPQGNKRWVPFFPNHFLAELTVFLVVVLVLVTAVLFVNYPLEEQADPFLTPMGAKPPWYFYFLYQLLKYLPPLLAAVLIPAGALMLLGVLPFIDRNPNRGFGERKIAVALGVLGVVALGALTYLASLPYGFE